MSEHTHITETIAAYALGAAAPNDLAEVLEHIAGCAPCRAHVRQMRGVADDLALTAEPVAVPAALTARIMDEIAADRATPAVVARAHPRARARRVLLVAAMLTVAALGAANVRLAGDLRTARARDRSAARAVAMLADPAATKTVLTGAGQGHLTLAVRPDGAAVLIGSDLAVPDGRALALWLISSDGVPAPGPLFHPGDQGSAVVELQIDVAKVTTVAVSVEERAVPRPTTTPIFHGVLKPA